MDGLDPGMEASWGAAASRCVGPREACG